jgi:hypothetical protein
MKIADAREISDLLSEYDGLTTLLVDHDDDDDATNCDDSLADCLHDSIFRGYDAPLDGSVRDALDQAVVEFSSTVIWDAIRTRRDTVAALLIVRGVEVPDDPDTAPVAASPLAALIDNPDVPASVAAE